MQKMKLIIVKNFLSLVVVVMVVAMSSMTVSCKAKGKSEGSSSDRYRVLVHKTLSDRALQYGASTRYMLLCDFSIPSNHDRFFVWDTEKDGIVYATWCAHGLGGNSTAEKPEFSNRVGSNCSSLGLYVVDRSTGVSPRYGYTYHGLDGLDATNSNARVRQVIIHYWSSVTNDWEAQISQPMRCDYRSAGCFTLPEPGFWKVDEYIKGENKRMLLLAIDGVE